jgi:hypothetical protein
MTICSLYLIMIFAIIIFAGIKVIKNRIESSGSNYTEYEISKKNYLHLYDGSTND